MIDNTMQEVYVLLKRYLSILLAFVFAVAAVPAFDYSFSIAFAEEEDEFYAEVGSTTGYTTYQRGDRDHEDSAGIVLIQTKLIELGYLADAADGVYGANTETAVAAFQRSHDLPDTGIADAATQDLIRNGTDLVHYSESMESGSVIYRTQEKLGLWGFTEDAPDGVSGEKTEEAIKAFKLYLDGYTLIHPTPGPAPTPTPAPEGQGGFGDAEIVIDEIIYETDNAEVDERMLDYVDEKYEFEVFRESVGSGDTGDEVLRVQRRLHLLKYLWRVDGEFGEATERALLYFQRKNGLKQTAVADEETQRLLFSADAVESEEYVNLYKLVIDVSDQRTRVYQWNGSSYGICINEMVCSTGTKEDPTPIGTFQAAGPSGTGMWYWFKTYRCYAKWGYFIVGGIMFHSIPYTKSKKLQYSAARKLGRRASHGCIRLEEQNAKWIYDNCPAGTTVVVQE